MSTEEQKYYKFLGPNLISQDGFYYNAPIRQNNRWVPGNWNTDPNPDRDTRDACGRGLHLMKALRPLYGRYSGNCYEAEGRGLLGEDATKARFVSVRLIRPVSSGEIFKPGANLSRAYLFGANLYRANLSGANLSEAYLFGADLDGADLSRANLSRANLSRAYLSGANLSGANLSGAYLFGADLYGADLYGANLDGADLSNCKLLKKDKSKINRKIVDNFKHIIWLKD